MIFGYAFSGLETVLVSVEVDISVTLPALEIVGLPASEVKEARERVKAAIRNSGYVWPNKKVLINLAPSDLKKRGAGLDLPIALAVLRATNQIPSMAFPIMALGELQLNGGVRPVHDVLAAIICAVNNGVHHFIVSNENASDVLCVHTSIFCTIRHLSDLRNISAYDTNVQNQHDTQIIEGQQNISSTCFWQRGKSYYSQVQKNESKYIFSDVSPSFSELSNCDDIKRVAQIVATGWHSILLCGVPGTGKTAAAIRIPTFLPMLTYEQSLIVSNIYACAGLLEISRTAVSKDDTNEGLILNPPIRQPHHSASLEAMIGSGSTKSIGEVSLAHFGLLILDEAPEFKTKVLQSLREPLDTRQVHVSRVGTKIAYPADFLCVLTCNLCPCGNRGRSILSHGDEIKTMTPWQGNNICMCSESDVFRYWKRIGGALWDRIDIKYQTHYKENVHVEEPLINRLRDVKERRNAIVKAQERQKDRFCTKKETSRHGVYSLMLFSNGRCFADDIAKFSLTKVATQYVKKTIKAGISDRGRIALYKVSRTIADLENDEAVCVSHVEEAMQYTMNMNNSALS